MSNNQTKPSRLQILKRAADDTRAYISAFEIASQQAQEAATNAWKVVSTLTSELEALQAPVKASASSNDLIAHADRLKVLPGELQEAKQQEYLARSKADEARQMVLHARANATKAAADYAAGKVECAKLARDVAALEMELAGVPAAIETLTITLDTLKTIGLGEMNKELSGKIARLCAEIINVIVGLKTRLGGLGDMRQRLAEWGPEA